MSSPEENGAPNSGEASSPQIVSPQDSPDRPPAGAVSLTHVSRARDSEEPPTSLDESPPTTGMTLSPLPDDPPDDPPTAPVTQTASEASAALSTPPQESPAVADHEEDWTLSPTPSAENGASNLPPSNSSEGEAEFDSSEQPQIQGPRSFMEDEKEMSLTEHLEELRSRILTSLAAWVVGAIVVYNFAPSLLSFTRPLLGNAELIFTSPMEAFMAYLKVALIGGFFAASPVIGIQALLFVLPGLKANEKRWLLTLMPFSVVLFCLGVAFAYVAVLPVTLKFFLSFQNEHLKATIKLDEHLEFVVNMLALCGLIFQLPLVMLFGSFLGIVKSSFLRSQRRLAYFLSFVIAAVATPTPDMVTATIVALPIIILFEISVLLIRITGK